MSNKRQNYFHALEEKEDGDDDNEDISAVTTTKPKISNNPTQGVKTFTISHSFKDNEKYANSIQNKIANVEQIELANFSPVVLKALVKALKDNRSVHTIRVTEANPFISKSFTEDAALSLREILSIPRIKFHVTTKYEGIYLNIFNGRNCVKYITHLDVEMSTEPLDRLLDELSKGTNLEYLCIRNRLRLKNLSRLGSFQRLKYLKIHVFDSGCVHLCKALLSIKTLLVLDLSNSFIQEKSAALSLADLLVQNTSITTLILNECKINDNSFSIISRGLIKNTTLHTLEISKIEPFKQIDLSIVGEITNKKRLKHLKLDSYDANMARVFCVDNLTMTTENFEGLKGQEGIYPEVFNLTIDTVSRKIDELFEVVNNNIYIKAVSIRQVLEADPLSRNLRSNTTLRKFAVDYLSLYSTSDWVLFCEMIEKNDTLEQLTMGGFHITASTAINVLKALQKNQSLTRVNFGSLYSQIENFKELLTTNPYISFVDDSNWSSNRAMLPEHAKIREEVIVLNERNKLNAKKRVLRKRMNIIILARSYLSRVVPMEVWQEIFLYVDAQLEHFALFQRSLAKE